MGTKSDIVARVRTVVARLRWRVRLQTALRHGLVAGAIGLALFAAAIAATKLRVLAPDTPLYAGIGALVVTAIGLAIGFARRLDDIALAASLDSAADLHSRLGSALAFARLERPTEMQRLAMEDALSVLDRAEPKRAAPWLFAPFSVGLVALALALLINVPALLLLDPKVPPDSVGGLGRLVVPPPIQRQTVTLKTEDKQTLERLSEDLSDDLREQVDPQVKEALADLNELIRALQEGRITAEDAHARLAELEKAMAEWKAQAEQQEAAEKKLADAAKAIKKTEPTLAQALSELQKRELEEAARRLEELQKKLDRGELDQKTQEKLAKDLKTLAQELKSERQKEKERLQKERDRLKEKEQKEKDRFAKKDKDRLKDVQRQLERFDEDHPAANESQRQLERLSDDLDDAAADLMRRLAEKMGPLDMPEQDSPEDIARRERERQQAQQGDQGENGDQGPKGQEQKAGQDGDDLSDEELEQAAKALKRMAKRAGGRQQMRAAGGKMVDLKEMLRRAAKQGQQGDDGDAQQAFERGAKGDQPGQNGEDGKGDQDGQMAGQPGGKGGDMMLLGGKGQGQPTGKIPGAGQGGRPGEGVGEGIGQGHDPNLVGEKTGMDVKTVEDFVQGKANDGPSQTRVIMAAAGRGFASRAYRDVHQDYAGVVEDALEKEHIPPGKRTYVRRYFDLIRPR